MKKSISFCRNSGFIIENCIALLLFNTVLALLLAWQIHLYRQISSHITSNLHGLARASEYEKELP